MIGRVTAFGSETVACVLLTYMDLVMPKAWLILENPLELVLKLLNQNELKPLRDEREKRAPNLAPKFMLFISVSVQH